MSLLQRVQISLFFLALIVPSSRAQSNSSPANTPAELATHDGQHDFDFELGSWKIHLKRLLKPLTASNSWVEFDGTSVTRKVWDGRSQIEEFEVDSPTGHIEGLTLRLYNPQTHQWSLYWANAKDGAMGGPPNVGEFKNGRGEFYCQDTFTAEPSSSATSGPTSLQRRPTSSNRSPPTEARLGK
ncbi:MAG TPA: hypothetical protein VLL05_02310 [Terriglobales bacterium]|nr:hypothetical protein [Terriglobales bacterium]